MASKRTCTIPGCPNRLSAHEMCCTHNYRVRRHGSTDKPVRKSVSERFWEKVDRRGPDECWEWTKGRVGPGYGQFSRGRVNGFAHRVSWELHHGAPPPGLHVLHKCDNPPCVNPAHLFLGTQADNIADMMAKGRNRWGNARLSEASVVEIRTRVASGESFVAIGAAYGVHPDTVRLAVSRKTWANVA